LKLLHLTQVIGKMDYSMLKLWGEVLLGLILVLSNLFRKHLHIFVQFKNDRGLKWDVQKRLLGDRVGLIMIN
tara:strand:+ start:72 stop:287 length:216 start_codon:yes stop_codon:yes gene_type:complete